MHRETPVLKYNVSSSRGPKTEVMVYENGEVNIKNHLTNKTILMSPENVNSWAERLVKAGFFDFKYSFNMDVIDACITSITLNYPGQSNTISWNRNRPDSKELENVINELLELRGL